VKVPEKENQTSVAVIGEQKEKHQGGEGGKKNYGKADPASDSRTSGVT